MESISRISSLLETARDLTLEAARDVGPRRSTRPLPAPQIKKLLDSRNERDVLDGLRRVIAMQYAQPPQPTLTFLPAVLKTLSTPYASTRPLVYNCLLHHAEQDPDTALLSINTIQKSLSDTNPRVRAMALKTMSGVRVPVISQIVSLAIKKGTSDLSPLVRKAAALACVKCVRLDPSTRPQIEDFLATLLADKQYYVAGAAVQALVEICPERLDLIHPVYRRLCKMVADMDEWGQLALIKVLTVYARRNFPRKTRKARRAATTETKNRDFYQDLDGSESSEVLFDEVEVQDPDLELFLKSILPLLQSHNSAVIVAVSRAYLALSPSGHLLHAIGPLIALLRSPHDIQQTALYNIVQVGLTNPSHLVPYFRHFLVRTTDGPQIWPLKLEVLTLVFPHCNRDVQDLILVELEHFSRGHSPELVQDSVQAIGRCAQSSDSATSRRCLTLLLEQIHSSERTLVSEAIEVVRHLIQRAPEEHSKTIVRLAKNLDTLTSPTGRASIIWLVGEFGDQDPPDGIAADVLRILVKNYADEDDLVRSQIILLAAKVYLRHLNRTAAPPGPAHDDPSTTPPEPNPNHETSLATSDPSSAPPHPIALLYQHTMLLARYTPSYDLRDRARLFRALLSVPGSGNSSSSSSSSTDLATLILLAPKPFPQAPSPGETRRQYTLGSASLIVGDAAGPGGLRGYEALPEWVEEGHEPDAGLREDGVTEFGAGVGVSGVGLSQRGEVSAGRILDRALETERVAAVGKGVKGKSLDDWLDEETEGEDESSDEEEEESESEEDSDEYETESEDEEEEEETESEEDERAGLVLRA